MKRRAGRNCATAGQERGKGKKRRKKTSEKGEDGSLRNYGYRLISDEGFTSARVAKITFWPDQKKEEEENALIDSL